SSAAPTRVPDDDGPPVPLITKHSVPKTATHKAPTPQTAAANGAGPVPEPTITEPEQKSAAQETGENPVATSEVAEPVVAASATAEPGPKTAETGQKIAEPKLPTAP